MSVIQAFDRELFDFVASHRAGVVTRFALGLMEAGASRNILVALALAGFAVLAWRRRLRVAVALTGGVVGAVVLAGFLKGVIGRPRPWLPTTLVHPSGFAMPSTHAAATAAAAVAVWLSVRSLSRPVRWAVGVALAAGLVGVGFLMVYLGAHWASDVLAGWALGAAVGAGASWLVAWCRPPSQEPPAGAG